MKILILILAVFFWQTVRADILFIDLNSVDEEIREAQAAAAKRGEKLIIIPSNREELKKYNKAKEPFLAAMNKASERYGQMKCKPDQRNPDCDKVAKEYWDAHNSFESFPNYHVKNLKEDLKNVPSDVTSVMISGHDGSGSFGGIFGRVEGEEFLDAFKQFKGRNNIKSLYLLGCYSSTIHTQGKLWKQSFPKASLVAGYEGVGYLRDNPNGHQFIRKALNEEPNLLAAKSIDQAQKIFRNFSPKDKVHGTAACLQPSDDPNDTMYLSSTNNADYLSKKLECKPEDHAAALKFLKCIHEDGDACPLKETQNYKNTDCNFLYKEEEVREKDKIYVLSGLSDPKSKFSVEAIFAKANPEDRDLLKLHPAPETFKGVKAKLAALRDRYEQSFNFDSVKDLAPEQLDERAQQKAYFDQAWLGVSNLDLVRLHALENPPVVSGGELRAQSFIHAAMESRGALTFSDRISNLESGLPNASSAGRQVLEREIAALKKYQIEHRLR